MNRNSLFRVHGVSKRFPGVNALTQVSFDVLPGEVHALVGENGAGKSTLMKILAGVYQPDEGQLFREGQPVDFRSPGDAQKAGISIIFQEFTLLPHLTVAENILLNREPRNRFGLLDWKAMNRRARELLALLETDIDPQGLVNELTVAQQQLTEIVKSLAVDARLLIMDEPTAALNPVEVGHLFKVIEHVRARGTGIIFISHRLEEVLKISQRITIMKDGQVVSTQPTSELNRDAIVRNMVGRELKDIFPARQPVASDAILLSVRDLTTPALQRVSLQLRPGEIVGLAGLEGQGQRELARALFGVEPIKSGEIQVDGKPVRLSSPQHAIAHGIAMVTDDRKGDGLALKLGVRENVALPNLPGFTRRGFVQSPAERGAVKTIIEQLAIKTPAMDQPIRLLSGGNQQKAVLGKWLVTPPRLMIIIEPTRGIDIGAKVEVYHLIHQLAQEGMGIVMVSGDLLELLGLSHRILVMHRGEVAAEIPGELATEESIMRAATGLNLSDVAV
jgi:ribose transport system ATP-binding protein